MVRQSIIKEYKAIWTIELFFRDIKQILHIKTFIGTSENAVKIQIWTALVTILLFKSLKNIAIHPWYLSVYLHISAQSSESIEKDTMDEQIFKTIEKDTTNEQSFRMEVNIDGYYRYASSKNTSLSAMALLHNTLDLGFVSMSFAGQSKKFGYVMNFALGPRADQYYSLDDRPFLNFIKEAYGYYKLKPSLKILLGTSTAFLGFEYADPHLNHNYSVSYVSSLSPATFTGLWSEYSINDQWTVSAGIYNDTDKKIDETKGVHLGALATFENDAFNASLGIYSGEEIQGLRATTYDVIADVRLSESFNIGAEITHFTLSDGDHYSGIVLYPTFKTSDKSTLCLRSEIFYDDDGLYFGEKNNVIYDLTLTEKMRFDHFYIMPEIKFDHSKHKVFNQSNYDFSFIVGVGYVY